MWGLGSRRAVFLALVLSAILGLGACSDGKNGASSAPNTPAAPPAPPPPPAPPVPATPPAPDSAGNVDSAISVAGVARQYLLHVPTGFDPATARPLVINLHGQTATRFDQQFISNFDPLADANNFMVVYPQGLGANLPFGGGFFASSQWDTQYGSGNE